MVGTPIVTEASSGGTSARQRPQVPAEASSILSTLNDDGSRRWLKPKPSPGRFLTARRAVAYLLIAIFTLIPFIQINGKPMILLDLAARRFTFFGKTFLPTDTLLLALLMVSIFVTVFLVTALAGRVWCGWGCPQTVYLEFLFRPIERLLDGAPGHRPKGIQGKPFAKILKYFLFFVVSLHLANTFLAYFVGAKTLHTWIIASPANHPTGFAIVLFVTALMMFDFSFFREQTCIVACPYGRFQSALLDRHSLIVSYDRVRGEPRGKAQKVDLALPVLDAGSPARNGDCIDCKMCVTTCPTGIDIRNGLQMECVGCAQCIDACDAIMEKISKPKGLIRYSSQSLIAGEKRRVVRPRVLIYSTILAIMVTAFLLVLSTKASIDVTIMRGLGRPFNLLPDGIVSNQSNIRLVNRQEVPVTITIEIVGQSGARIVSDSLPAVLAPGESKLVPATFELPASAFKATTQVVTIRIRDAKDFSKDVPFRMMGPRPGSVPASTTPATGAGQGGSP